ncbi:hypothetical protein DW810_08155 [Phocaeicola vulgatus]|nr:hypothetical protein DW810_08155 [Phocaeicola vulgatus]
MTIRMAYEMVMPYHLHMPSYFLETFTEYPSDKLFLKLPQHFHHCRTTFVFYPELCHQAFHNSLSTV